MDEVVDGLGFTLWQLQHRIQRMQERRMAELRLTLPQAAVLISLATEPGKSSADLARHLLLSPQAVSLMISRLEAAGYLTRAAPTTGRSQPLTITTTGKAALADAQQVFISVHEEVFGGHTDTERAQLQDLLDRSLRAAKESGHERSVRSDHRH